MIQFVQAKNTKHFSQFHFLIFCNPKAGKGRALKEKEIVVDFFQKHSIAFTLHTEKSKPSALQFDCILIIGGDGTLHHVVNMLSPIQVPIVLIKGGTGNDFYSLLHGKLKTIDMLNTLYQKFNTLKFDIGKCNDTFFVNGIGIGFDAAVVQHNKAKKYIPGKLGYFIDVLSMLFQYNEQEVQVQINKQKPFSLPLFMLTIANGKTYGGGFKVAPKASIEDGKLDCIVVQTITKWRRLLLLPVMERGKHLNLKEVNFQQIQNCQISSNTALAIHLDGELKQHNFYDIQILPKQMSFLVP